MLDPEALIKSYYHQLTVGCEAIECTNHYCKSCRDFCYILDDENDIAIEAINLAIKHPSSPKLCSIRFRDKYISFNSALDQFMLLIKEPKTRENMDLDCVLAIFLSTVLDSELFPFIMSTNYDSLSLVNMAIDNNTILMLIQFIESNAMNIHNMFSLFMNMCYEIIKGPQSFGHVRALLLMFCFEYIIPAKEHERTYTLFISAVLNLSNKAKKLFWSTLQQLPALFKNIPTNIVSAFSATNFKHKNEKLYQKIGEFMRNLRRVSNLPPNQFYLNIKLVPEEIIDMEKEFSKGEPSLLDFPELICLKDKLYVVSKYLAFILNGNPIVVSINRHNLLEESLRKIGSLDTASFAQRISIKFVDEAAVDQGGVSREFYYELVNSAFHPDFGMFVLIKKRFYWFSHHLLCDLSYYSLLGTIVGLAIQNRVILPIRFPRVFYKRLLGRDIVLDDLAEIDESFFSSANHMLSMRSKKENIDDLCLNFSTTVEEFGVMKEVPLIQNGDEIPVTDSNIDIYISSYIEWFCFISIDKQFQAFNKGMRKVLVSNMLKIFEPEELDILLSGEEVYNWDDFKKNIKLDGYDSRSKPIIWFFKLFDTMTNEQKKSFLRFTTGTDRAPLGGLSSVHIRIQKTMDIDRLPESHTCFNSFHLPSYRSESKLRSMVLSAIEHCVGFGML